MADISSIKLPSGSVYNFKDAKAREDIAALAGADIITFKGVSTTALTDGGNEKPTVGGVVVTPKKGELYFYNSEEFVYGPDNKWHELGSLQSLGDLAAHNVTDLRTTPQGSVSAPTISLNTAGSTTTIKNPTAQTVAKTISAAAPGTTAPDNSLVYYAVSNEVLSLYQIGYTTGDSIETENVTVKTSDATYESSTPSFSGTQTTISYANS